MVFVLVGKLVTQHLLVEVLEFLRKGGGRGNGVEVVIGTGIHSRILGHFFGS